MEVHCALELTSRSVLYISRISRRAEIVRLPSITTL